MTRRRREQVEISVEELHEVTAREMLEADLQANIVRLARSLGWRVYHAWRSDHSEAGFPDLVLVRRDPDRLMVAELKRQGKEPTGAQVRWLDDLGAAGVPAFVWRPADWLDGSIEAVLRGR